MIDLVSNYQFSVTCILAEKKRRDSGRSELPILFVPASELNTVEFLVKITMVMAVVMEKAMEGVEVAIDFYVFASLK